MGYRLVIFDMDGTVLDTLEDLTDALNYVFAQYGQPCRSLEEVRGFVGNGIKTLISRAVRAGTSDGETERIYNSFMPYYKAHCADKTKPYDGITELLRQLKEEGLLTAVVSNKADTAVRLLCEQYFNGLFDYCVGEKAGIPRKPAPDSVYEVLEQLSIDKKDAVYVGDSEVDLATAKNAGLDCIAVSWGFRDEGFLSEHGAVRIASEPEEVMEHLKGRAIYANRRNPE
ncbi:MAG: HAD-IA family hydrolase [Lachnospiraceae bacterium]|nr:HAD-IA family hydrolase [Lachnospiraceae bacterium]